MFAQPQQPIIQLFEKGIPISSLADSGSSCQKKSIVVAFLVAAVCRYFFRLHENSRHSTSFLRPGIPGRSGANQFVVARHFPGHFHHVVSHCRFYSRW